MKAVYWGSPPGPRGRAVCRLEWRVTEGGAAGSGRPARMTYRAATARDRFPGLSDGRMRWFVYCCVLAAGVHRVCVRGKWPVEMAVCWPAIHPLHPRGLYGPLGHGRMLRPVGLVRASASAAERARVGAEGTVVDGSMPVSWWGQTRSIRRTGALCSFRRPDAAFWQQPCPPQNAGRVCQPCPSTARDVRRVVWRRQPSGPTLRSALCLGHRRGTRRGRGARWLLEGNGRGGCMSRME